MKNYYRQIIPIFISFTLLYVGFSWFLLRLAKIHEIIDFNPSTNILAAVILGLINILTAILLLKKCKLNFNAADLSLLLFNLWTISSLFWCQNMSIGCSYFMLTGLAMLFYFNMKLCFKIDSELTKRWVLYSCFIIIFITVLQFFIQLYLDHLYYTENNEYYRFGLNTIKNTSGILGKKNWMTKFLFILIPVLGVGIQSGDYRKMINTSIVLIIVMLLLINTRSTLFGLILLCSFLVMFSGGIQHKKILLYGCLSLLMATLILWLIDPIRYFSNFNLIDAWSSRSIQMRFSMWQKSISLFLQSPITGVGVGQWEVLHQQFGEIDSIRPNRHFAHPHNDFFRILAELGIVGFGFFIAFFVFHINETLKKRKKDFVFLLSFAFIPAYLFVSFFDENIYKLPNQIFLMIPLAYISSSSSRNVLKWKLPANISIALISVFVIVVGASSFKIEVSTYRIKELIDSKKWGAANEEFVLNSTFYYDTFQRYPIDYLKGLTVYKARNYKSAYQYFLNARNTSPYYKANLLYLVRVLTKLDRDIEAMAILVEGMEYFPSYEILYIEAIKIELKQNDIMAAQNFLSKVKSSAQKKKYQKEIEKKLAN